MSGGHFDYNQYKIETIGYEIEELINSNCDTEKNELEYHKGNFYSKETIDKFKRAVSILKQAAIMAQRIDWLVSGDDSEKTFHERWDDELNE